MNEIMNTVKIFDCNCCGLILEGLVPCCLNWDIDITVMKSAGDFIRLNIPASTILIILFGIIEPPNRQNCVADFTVSHLSLLIKYGLFDTQQIWLKGLVWLGG